MRKFVLILLCVAMSGCLTFSWRRGASGEAMSADEKSCRETTETDAAYEDCLRSRGIWLLDAGTPERASSPAAPADQSEASEPAPAKAESVAPSPDDDTSDGFGTLPPDERDGAAQPLIGDL